MTDIHLRKLKKSTEEYIETYGRENKILKTYKGKRSVNTQQTAETIIEEHREFTQAKLWNAIKGTKLSLSVIEKKLKSRKFATYDFKTECVICSKDFFKRGKLHKVLLSFCDNCSSLNDCPCKQNSYTKPVSKSPTPLKSTRHNGDGSVIPNSSTVSEEVACPMLDGQIIHIVKCDICKAKTWNIWRQCKEGRLKISQ